MTGGVNERAMEWWMLHLHWLRPRESLVPGRPYRTVPVSIELYRALLWVPDGCDGSLPWDVQLW